MNPANLPKNELKRIEYLLLSIQSNPGRSQRWHLKRLHLYVYSTPDHHKGGWNCGYFTSPSYRNVLWVDAAPKEIVYQSFAAVDKVYPPRRSKSAQMYLTRSGWERANQVRQKLKLKPICWSLYELPDTAANKIYQTGVCSR